MQTGAPARRRRRTSRTDTCTQGRQHLPAGSSVLGHPPLGPHSQRVFHWGGDSGAARNLLPQTCSFPARHPTLHEAATGDCDARPQLSTAEQSKSQAAPGRAAVHGRPRTQLTGAPPDSPPPRHTATAKRKITPERQHSNDCQLAEPTKPEGDVGFHGKRPGLMDSTHFEVSERKNYQLVNHNSLWPR